MRSAAFGCNLLSINAGAASVVQKIVFLIPHFGPWPVWINHFVESCRANPTIDWILFSDAGPPTNTARNVRHVTMAFTDYKQLVSAGLGVTFDPQRPYKLCDIRPALAHIHADLVKSYDFVGFGDIDLIYGNLRAFFDEQTLDSYDVFSTHADRISGHLCLMRNRPDVITVYRSARGWERAMTCIEYVAFDEQGFYRLFRPARSDLIGQWRGSPCRVLFREAYSTPAATHAMAWFWQAGCLTNEFYPQHPFMYLHFMSWHSARWYGDQPFIGLGAAAPWARLEQVVQADWRHARKKGFMISPAGIQDIARTVYS